MTQQCELSPPPLSPHEVSDAGPLSTSFDEDTEPPPRPGGIEPTAAMTAPKSAPVRRPPTTSPRKMPTTSNATTHAGNVTAHANRSRRRRASAR